jgi:peptidoglycan/xylan/chitin deacetylase (PgdA/CDA1 family)
MKELILYQICRFMDLFIRHNDIPILLYHSISDTQSRLAVSANEFAKQTTYLYEQGYKTITPTDIFNVITGKEKRVLITFDDGFKDNLTAALPILKRHGFMATVFISTDYIGKQSDFCRDEEEKHYDMLTAEDIKTLARDDWTIASHFASHRDLDKLSADEVKREYGRAREALAAITGSFNSGEIVSYPHSRANPLVADTIKKAGANMAFSGRVGLSNKHSDRFALPRIEIDRDISFLKFKLFLSPTFNRLKKLYYEK